ncbi:hypothetical protein [Sorangium cellulosum]|uniref:hypothetical protein n=1 Tax=Sorangium cellulosum TaxID=56 RepID=UPI000CF3EE1A|nr:hypothetical protein [Sorangium cellulosum]
MCGKLHPVEDEVTGTPFSAASAASAASTARDAAEIRGRIAACFSLIELRRFSDELGVTGISWDRGIKEAAHELVRRFEQRGELWSLVAHLRDARPLVEWPDLRTVPPPSSIAHTAADIPRPAPLPKLTPIPVPIPTEAPTLAPPIPPTTRTPVTPASPFAAAPLVGAGARAASTGRAAAAARAPTSAARRIDPRVLLAALGLVVASLVVAFLMGRASSDPAEAAAPSSEAPPAPQLRPEGLATRAAAAVDRRVEAVARVCEIPPGPADDVMRRAFERCGPALPPSPQRPAGAGARGAEAAPAEQATRPPPPSSAAAPRAPEAGGKAGCVGACERRHRACKATQCGREPTQSSQYQRYQSCLSDCLEQASKCRLGCL